MQRILAVLILSLGVCAAQAGVRTDARAEARPEAQTEAHGLPDFTELVAREGAAVVNISTTQIVRNVPGMPSLPFDENDPAFELFRRLFPPGQFPGRGAPRELESHSLGSGFILSGDGYVMTNAHVVDAADEVVVRLTDKREFKAKVIGSDKRTDIALLKIDASGLPTVRIGDPKALRVGEWVVAIGSPFGFDNSVTAGIVSAKGRSLPDENYVPFIQTDVAINPGNSGGPLFNMRGEVVGINSQIYSGSGGYMGIAFAIPIDLALDVQNQLRQSGRVSRGRMGVNIQELTRDIADSLHLQKAQGALVSAVEKGGPADKAGIETGDVVLRFDGKPVTTAGDLQRLVGSTRPGTRVGLQVWRNGATRELTLTLAELPGDAPAARQAPRPRAAERAPNRLGLVVSPLTAAQQKELQIDGGLLIEEVRGGVRTDLQQGDVIVALVTRSGVRTPVSGVEQFNRLLGEFDRNAAVTLLVRRGERQVFITLKAPEGGRP